MSGKEQVIELGDFGNDIDDEDAAEFSNELEKLKTKLDQDDSESASPDTPSTPVKISVTESSPTNSLVCDKSGKSTTQKSEKAKDLEKTNTDDIIKQLVSNQGNGSAKQLKPPESKPGAVCFNYPNTDLTHLDVKEAVEKYLQSQPDIMIEKIEFQPRCKLMLPPDKVETNICRWVITVDSDWGRKRLNNREFSIRDISIVLKNYDEIVALEFRQFGRMAQIMNLINRK
ncbi:hypothetical protein LOTGIDRAFT_161917 [Lottia gigantea]|uniref:Uncharacterized protein n=1 Tax=Lottia gigantea TaxID=225164 RepID=V4A9E3_LOTGI|nr:hypothetical protein LOTGIDRAFT_161917 [Lottia gigantea]ESO93352.1 hypothetical protein LOTGIDRAFT_161917 [Lottia gigantea]